MFDILLERAAEKDLRFIAIGEGCHSNNQALEERSERPQSVEGRTGFPEDDVRGRRGVGRTSGFGLWLFEIYSTNQEPIRHSEVIDRTRYGREKWSRTFLT